MAPSVCFTQPATPSLPFAPVPVGHFTDLSLPGPLAHAGEYATRNFVKFAVVPDSSERWHTLICVAGRETPLLSFLISASSQLLTLPRKMSAIVAPSSFRPLSIPLTL